MRTSQLKVRKRITVRRIFVSRDIILTTQITKIHRKVGQKSSLIEKFIVERYLIIQDDKWIRRKFYNFSSKTDVYLCNM